MLNVNIPVVIQAVYFFHSVFNIRMRVEYPLDLEMIAEKYSGQRH